MRHVCLIFLIIAALAALTESFLFWRFCHRRDCAWNSWGAWGSCSLKHGSCGSGIQMRHRGIRHTQTCGGRGCSGSRTSIRACTKCCQVNCAWGNWGAWSHCAYKSGCCGEGTQTRKRPYARPPTCGGHRCIGIGVQHRSCKKCCPTACVWGPWGPWGTCSATSGRCGPGQQVRSRPVRIKEACGGKCPGSASSTRECDKCCPENCIWGPWGSWTGCVQDCSGWRRKRFRRAKTQATCGGQTCHSSERFERITCSQPC